MSNKFTILLLGPAGSGKSTFVAALSKTDITKYVAAKEEGGANTTKITTTYEFSSSTTEFNVADCICMEEDKKEALLSELQEMCKQENGIEKVISKVNDPSFAQVCTHITITLPCKEGIIPDNCIFDSIVVRDSRGLGDIDENSVPNFDELGITYDVNAILFFSISQIKQPVIFSKIIDQVMQFNLKTPIFSLRRYPKVTKNDQEFEEKILRNIEVSDRDLFDSIIKLGNAEKEYRLNNFVFNLPEVEQWAGVLDIDNAGYEKQVNSYTDAMKEFLSYSISMYNELYNTLVSKMQGQYQDKFINLVLNNLLSTKAFETATRIVSLPHSKPSDNYVVYRDTKALALPVMLSTKRITEQPFRSELKAAGNRYKDGVIPSYSYSCVNFRNIFHIIVNQLTKEYSLRPLFCTFIDMYLEKYTITAYTGYQNEACSQNAFKFDFFLSVRDECTKILLDNKLADNEGKWDDFTFKPKNKKYSNEEAIAVFVYSRLINKLSLDDIKPSLDDTAFAFVEKTKKTEIYKQLKRN
ncbi:hypothetical protein BK131_02755 [Paenibacillus amylolyticus]|uniref:Uncharacterized protein n=1 Tax=Paenibacillus amylolyticus TaxID=1451 RepID=A0A1R1C476_PAEAM|nr:hypothetical protein [Paenibacillus amylolyticus]OMF16925.1 hypothetical protein BK131_02755 [Paenibacillus amylolyticus]